MNLFKYVGPNRLSILKNREIAFSAPSAFNDPFEMSAVIHSIMKPEEIDSFTRDQLNGYSIEENVRKEFEKQIEEYWPLIQQHRPDLQREDLDQFYEILLPQAKPFLESHAPEAMHQVFGLTDPVRRKEFSDSLYKKMNKTIRVLSLSSRNEDILMWSHYADSHRGFAVGFDSENPFFDQRNGAEDTIRRVKKVVYSEQRPEFHGFSSDPTEAEVQKFADLVLFTKSVHWEYEQEWRMVHTVEGAFNSVGEENEISLFELPPDLFKCVVLGAKISNELESQIRDEIESGPMSHISIYRARLDPDRYSVIVEGEI